MTRNDRSAIGRKLKQKTTWTSQSLCLVAPKNQSWHPREFGEPLKTVQKNSPANDSDGLFARCRNILAGMDRLKHGRVPLPSCFGEELRSARRAPGRRRR